MATDYDAPRRRAEDMDDDGEIVEPFDLPSVDVAGEELNVTVIPRRENEFTCSVCFLVQNNSRIDHTEPDGSIVCKDCA